MPDATPAAAPTAVASATFAVPAETVWAYRLDFANLPEYNPDVRDVTRVADGSGDAAGGVHGPGARYTFGLADPRRPGVYQPIELWTVEAVAPTLVAAGMSGGSEAYEEFVVEPLAAAGARRRSRCGSPCPTVSPRRWSPRLPPAACGRSARSCG